MNAFVDNFPWLNNKTGILKVQAAYIAVSIWVPLLPSNCLNPFFQHLQIAMWKSVKRYALTFFHFVCASPCYAMYWHDD